jgi:hypothetical protein
LGSQFFSGGVWHTSGFSGTFAGRVVVIGGNAAVEGKDIPVTIKQSTDSLRLDFTTGHTQTENESSGYTSTAARRGQWLALLNRETTSGNDRLFYQCRDRFGAFTNEPVLNRDARITSAITSGSIATPFELKPNLRYRVNIPAAAATIRLDLPDDSTSGEVIAVDDEIEIFVAAANGQTVQINQVGTQTIRLAGTVTTSGLYTIHTFTSSGTFTVA